jgi:hypothetical protein
MPASEALPKRAETKLPIVDASNPGRMVQSSGASPITASTAATISPAKSADNPGDDHSDKNADDSPMAA